MKQKNKIGVVIKWKNKKYVQWQKNVAVQLAGDFLRRTVKEKAKADQKTFERYLSGRTDYWYEKSISL